MNGVRTPGTVELQPRKSARRTDFFKMWLICAKWASFLQNAGAQALWRIRTRHFGRPKSPKCPLKSPDCAAKAPECGADFSSPRTLPKRGGPILRKAVFSKKRLPQFLIANACHLREMSSVAFFRKRACRLWEKGRCRCRNSEEADFRENACIEIMNMDEVGFFL